jgi:hypothetical protein
MRPAGIIVTIEVIPGNQVYVRPFDISIGIQMIADVRNHPHVVHDAEITTIDHLQQVVIAQAVGIRLAGEYVAAAEYKQNKR